MYDEEHNGDRNEKRGFFGHRLVTTGRCSLERFQGGSKVKIYIGIFHFWINSLRKVHLQDVVVTLLQILWLNKRKSLTDSTAAKFVTQR